MIYRARFQGLKPGQALSSYGSTTGFNLYRPHRGAQRRVLRLLLDVRRLDVALQVEFERQILKPVFHLIGFRLWV
jgi:hypothetical protein